MNVKEFNDRVFPPVPNDIFRKARKISLQNIKKYADAYKKYSFILNLEKLFQALLVPAGNKKPIFIFYGFYLDNIILNIKNKYPLVLLVRGYKDRLFAIKHNIPYVSIGIYCFYLNQFVVSNNEADLEKLKSVFGDFFSKFNPACIVSYTDAEPIEMCFIYFAKLFGVKFIDVQHGFYFSFGQEGHCADYMFVWSQYLLEVYEIKNVKKKEYVKILGYPYVHKIYPLPNKIKTIYFFEQSLREDAVGHYRFNAIEKIAKLCEKYGLNFICRLYKQSDEKMMRQKYPKMSFETILSPISKSISRGDVFISFDSTALLEAFVNNKFAIQILDIYPIKTQNFQDLGACDITLKSVDDLEDYFKLLLGSTDLSIIKKPLNPKLLKLTESPADEFLKILNEIKIID